MSEYVSEHASSQTYASQTQEFAKIDALSFLKDIWYRFHRLWWIVLVCTAAFAALSWFHKESTYVASYTADATVSVQVVNGGSYSNASMAEQLATVYPHIRHISILQDAIEEDLGLSYVPGTLTVSHISGTNLVNFSVTATSADDAYNVLQSVLKNYPIVAQYVVGQTELAVVDDSGVPDDNSRTVVMRGSIYRGAILGFIIGLIILVFYTLLFRTIRDEDELRSAVNIPYMGTLPYYQKRRKKGKNGRDSDQEINILYDSDAHAYIESMRLIRTRLERQLEGNKMLMVTSSIPGEGKSTVAANLAISMARKGRSVILVDCDMRKPSQNHIFNIGTRRESLGAVLKGTVPLEDALYEVTYKDKPIGLQILAGGDRETRSVEMLGSAAMRRLLDQLKSMADIVILDTPPSALLVDAMMLTQYVDGVAYVIMTDYARRRYIQKGIEELAGAGATIVGCIINGGNSRSRGYGYYGGRYGYYGRGYGYGYGYGYGSEKSSRRRSGKTSSKSTTE